MKRTLSIILFLIISLGTVQTYASDVLQDEKQVLPVLIVNNSYLDTRPSLAKMKAELPPILMGQIIKSLEAKYIVKQIDNTFNISDVASTEKSDILDMFKETNYPAVILVEIIQPTFTYSIHVKVFDIKTQKYLYNGKMWSDKLVASSAMNDMNVRLDKILKDAFKL